MVYRPAGLVAVVDGSVGDDVLGLDARRDVWYFIAIATTTMTPSMLKNSRKDKYADTMITNIHNTTTPILDSLLTVNPFIYINVRIYSWQ